MKSASRLVAIIGAALLLVACGTEVNGSNQTPNNGNGQTDTGTPDSGSDHPDLFEEADSLLEAHCEKIFECCDSSQRLDELGLDVESVEECKNQERGIFRGVGTAQLEVSIHQGRVEVDEAMISACESQIADLSCADFQGTREERNTLPGCAEITEGIVPNGGTCSADYECESDLCVIEGDDEEGSCEPLPELGDDCHNRRCAGAAWCDRFDDRCMEQRQRGESCSEHDECISGYCGEIEDDGIFINECDDRPPRCDG